MNPFITVLLVFFNLSPFQLFFLEVRMPIPQNLHITAEAKWVAFSGGVTLPFLAQWKGMIFFPNGFFCENWSLWCLSPTELFFRTGPHRHGWDCRWFSLLRHAYLILTLLATCDFLLFASPVPGSEDRTLRRTDADSEFLIYWRITDKSAGNCRV